MTRDKEVWERAQTILDRNDKDKGKALIVLGIFLMFAAGFVEILNPLASMTQSSARLSQILIGLGVMVFLIGISVYVLKD